MPKLKFAGPMRLRIRSFLAINRIALATYARHALGRRMAPDWDAHLEIGIRFWRHQHTAAMNASDMVVGRQIYDSLQTATDDHYAVTTRDCDDPTGTWYDPVDSHTDTVILHFHGGGYALHGQISRRYASMLAHHSGARLFAPDYRLTPEHPHPAQADDALAAWRYVAKNVPPARIVVTGDSAGGHMALMLLQTLRDSSLDQPALCIGLCPWTDIGARGASLTENDRYDLVQGWMAVRFGEWLDPDGRFGRAALSPISHDYAGLAPIYLQAGGREVLRDMIVDFAQAQAALGADIAMDLWPDMPHDFQAYDRLKTSSIEALSMFSEAVRTRRLPATRGKNRLDLTGPTGSLAADGNLQQREGTS